MAKKIKDGGISEEEKEHWRMIMIMFAMAKYIDLMRVEVA